MTGAKSPAMNKGRFAVAAGIVAVLLAVALIALRPAPPLVVRCSKVAMVGDSLRVTLEVSNRTSQAFGIRRPIRLERWEENQWKKVPDGVASFSLSGDFAQMALFGVRRHGLIACVIKPSASGTRLRLIVESQRGRKGLQSFALRARLRIAGDNRISLNPFDKALFFNDPVEVTTDEFVAP